MTYNRTINLKIKNSGIRTSPSFLNCRSSNMWLPLLSYQKYSIRKYILKIVISHIRYNKSNYIWYPWKGSLKFFFISSTCYILNTNGASASRSTRSIITAYIISISDFVFNILGFIENSNLIQFLFLISQGRLYYNALAHVVHKLVFVMHKMLTDNVVFNLT